MNTKHYLVFMIRKERNNQLFTMHNAQRKMHNAHSVMHNAHSVMHNAQCTKKKNSWTENWE